MADIGAALGREENQPTGVLREPSTGTHGVLISNPMLFLYQFMVYTLMRIQT